jgi:hypothetical protein
VKHPPFALELGAFGGGFLERLRTRGMTARVRQRAIEQEPDLNGVSRVGKLGIDRLMQFPMTGTTRGTLAPGLRSIRVRPFQHLIFYRVVEDQLVLIRLLHGARALAEQDYGP